MCIRDRDYAATALETLIVPAGADRAPLDITLFDDTLHEGLETVVIEILNVSTAGQIGIGAQSTYTLEVDDDDPEPEVSFVRETTAGFEDAGPILVPVELDAVSGLDVVIPLIATGTAGDSDFSLEATEVVIPAGQQRVDVVVLPVDDDTPEGPEDVVLAFGELVGAVPGMTTAASINFEDLSLIHI